MNINEYELFLKLENAQSKNQRLMIEPMAMEFEFPSNSVMTIHLLGPTPVSRALPHVKQTERGTVFYVWPGTAFEIFCDGKLLSAPINECFRERIPKGWYENSVKS